MEPCVACSFSLWNPIHVSLGTQVGLYSDGRFPGRLILSLQNHYDHLDDVPFGELANFMVAIQRASRIMKKVAEVERVNVAILGNQESHVHAHLIPRRANDDKPTKAPWEDGRPRCQLSSEALAAYLAAYGKAFTPEQ